MCIHDLGFSNKDMAGAEGRCRASAKYALFGRMWGLRIPTAETPQFTEHHTGPGAKKIISKRIRALGGSLGIYL